MNRRVLMTLSLLAITLAIASPAHAVRQCKPLKKDARVCEVAYDPNDVIELTGVVGSPMTIELGADEAIPNDKSLKVADIVHVHPGFLIGGHIITLQFVGCLVPEPMTVITRKGNEDRIYLFQIETTPTACVTPDMQAPANNNQQRDGTPLFVSAALAHTAEIPWNMKYLPGNNPNALATGSTVPFLVRVRYPRDEAAASARRRRAADEMVRNQEAQQLLDVATKTGSNFDPHRQNLFYANGDLSLMPSSMTTDQNTTTLYFPENQKIPVPTSVGNPAIGYGKDGAETTKDFNVSGNTMTIAGTSQAWCLRSANGSVLEIWDSTYNPIGRNPGTGTVRPDVLREVKGAPDNGR